MIWRYLSFAGLAALAGGATLLSTAGCDPCFGVGQCIGEPRLAIEGELLVHGADTQPLGAHGVAVEFRRSGGVALEVEVVEATTDAEGRYFLTIPAAERGVVEGALRIRAPGRAEYTIEGLHFQASGARGEGQVVPRWVVNPYFPHIAELYRRDSGQLLAHVEIEFRRTGGVELFGPGWVEEHFRGRTDGAGRVILLEGVYPHGMGEVVGTLTIGSREERVDTVPEVRLSSTQLAYDPWRITRRGIGPSLHYQGELFHLKSGERADGVRIEFRRIAGVRAKPETYATVTDAAGRFPLVLQTSEAGVVLAEIVVHQPTGGEPQRIPIEIPTFDGDEVRLLGVWGIGEPHGEGEEPDG